jgi:YVTN family beta-propeller protein
MLTLALTLLLGGSRPSTPVVRGPRSTTSHRPVFRFVSRERGVAPVRIAFRCSFDQPRLHRCHTRFSQGLALGRHVLRVQAVDPAGRKSRVRLVSIRVRRAGGPRITRVEVDGRPFSLAEAGGAIWVANFLSEAVQRIDPSTNRVTANIEVGGQPYGITAGGGSVWVGNNALDSVARIDTATNRVVATVAVGDRPLGLAYDAAANAVWVADFGDSAVTEIDAVTNGVRARVVVPGEHEDVALGFGSLWIPSEEGMLTRLDPSTLAVAATIPVAADPDFALVTADSVWTTAYAGTAISRIDPATNSVTRTIPARRGLQGIAFDGSAFWVAGYDDGLVEKLDPATGAVLGHWPTDGGPRDVLLAAGSIWVANSRAPTVLRLTPAP